MLELTNATQQGESTMAPPSKPWPIRVISLVDSFDRRKRIKAQLDRLFIPFEFVDAIDGRAGLSHELEHMIDRSGTIAQFGRRMTDAEYACALSHMSVYREIIEKGLPGAVVLEDDAILGPLFKDFLDARGYEAGEVIQLDHMYGHVWRLERRLWPTPSIKLARALKNACLATGYTISQMAASHVLIHGLPLRGPADWPCDMTALHTMLAIPRVVDHPEVEESGSSLEAERALLQAEHTSNILALPKENRSLRFFKSSYWRRWWAKRMTKRVS